MKILAISALLFISIINSSGQNLLGYNDEEIKKYMRENRKEMNLEKVTNNDFHYLKYSDSSDSQTILFFLDNKAICNNIRVICDESIKTQKLNELNSIYKQKGEKTWTDIHNGKACVISLKDEDWSFVITMEPEK